MVRQSDETRPWKVYGEGPNSIKAGSFQGGSVSKLGEKDIRFTEQNEYCDFYADAGLADRAVYCAVSGTSQPQLTQAKLAARTYRDRPESQLETTNRCSEG